MGLNNAYLSSDRTSGSDECITPRYGVLPIVKYLKQKEYKTIWCPFDEEHSQYVRVLKSEGFIVINTHKFDGYDFLAHTLAVEYDCIVSNPPFSIKTEILKKVYSLNKPFALLLPQNSLQSIKRVKLYLKYGLEYLGFDRRICFYTKGELDAWKNKNHFTTGYFCKDVLPEKIIFEKLNPIQEPYL